MAIPPGIGIIDTMIGFPSPDMRELYSFITRQTKDRESKEKFAFPAEYMFKETPEKALTGAADPVAVTLAEMDRWGVEIGMIGLAPPGPDHRHGDPPGPPGEEPAPVRALRQHPDRFCASVECNPNKGMAGVRAIVRAHETYGIRAVSFFPAGSYPQVAINDKLMYPVYAKCVELGLPIFVCAGVPGPRLKMAPQRVELIDEVMFDFPELVLVTRHGCEPWTDLAVKLLLKWPNLYYSTSAFAPRYYPRDIIDFANTRGADKIIYAGYFPMGLSLERIMTEMAGVGFKDEVWPKFLRHNAARVLGLPQQR